MKIHGIDHVEYYVGDIAQSAAHLCDAFGFRIHGIRGGPDGEPAGHRSLLLRQGQIQILLTSGLSAGHPAADFVRRHGDGIAVVAFATDDVQGAFDEVVAAGGTAIAAPEFATADGSRVGTAVVSGFGDVVHKLVERSGPADEFAPGSIEMTAALPDDGLVTVIDHVAACLPAASSTPPSASTTACSGWTRSMTSGSRSAARRWHPRWSRTTRAPSRSR